MSKIQKMMEVSKKSVEINADIALINQHSLKELTPEDVFAFAVTLCDNEIDRDFDLITTQSLEKLAPLFVGKTGIFDHARSAKNQVARLYKVEVENGGGKTSQGEQKKVLKGYAYILRDDSTAEIISKIEGGILKEVSVGFSVESCVCSICGGSITWWGCENGHDKGFEYDGKQCYGILENPVDAYEFSFVAVPAQRGAGVTKHCTSGDVEKAFQVLMAADLEPYGEKLDAVVQKFKNTAMDSEERRHRKQILEENKKFTKRRDTQ